MPLLPLACGVNVHFWHPLERFFRNEHPDLASASESGVGTGPAVATVPYGFLSVSILDEK